MTNLWKAILLIGAGVLCRGLTYAEDQAAYCAFEVTVRSPRGEAIAGATVSELAMGGKIIGSSVTDRQGIARICDAPKGLVDIQVGDNRCGAVTVAYLKAYWLQTRRVSITYENCSGEEWAVAGGCLLTIRVKDQRNAPIPSVFFEDRNERPGPQTKLSDDSGRVFRFIKFGETMSGRLLKDRYLPQEISQACRPGDPPERESTIVLREGNGGPTPPR